MRWVVWFVMLGACGGGQAPSVRPEEKPVPSKVVEPPPPDPLRAELNLDFEEGDPPRGWPRAASDATEHHSGTRSLRLDGSAGGFKPTSILVPIERVRGKTIVVRGWIKARGVSGNAALWTRADLTNDMLALCNTEQQPVKGDSAWTQVECRLDVPPDADRAIVGAYLAGPGSAWIDDLTVEVRTPVPVALAVTVVDAQGAAVPGAIVALVPTGTSIPKAVGRTDAEGRVTLEGPAGAYALTATGRGGTAFYDPMAERASGPIKLTLDGPGFELRGRIPGWPAGKTGQVHLVRLSNVEGDIFVTEIGPDGTFAARLPIAESYDLIVDGPGPTTTVIKGTADLTLEVAYTPVGPPPPEVVAWVRDHAIPLTTVEAEHGFDDLAPVGKLVGKARVVGLGEATHGTREFFQAKHRLVEYLVAKQGFTVFAIEANQPEARAVDDYVMTGKGDPKKALAGLYFWTWNTEEVLAMIEWMRKWNETAPPARKVRFTGFDMQTPAVAAASVRAYLGRVDPSWVVPPLEELEPATFSRLTREHATRVLAIVGQLGERLDAQRKAYVAASSAGEWETVRQDLRVVAQALGLLFGGDRDQAMADNLDWILGHSRPGAKVIAWAHNGHLAFARGGLRMGRVVRERLGKRYVVIGFAFRRGGFQARGTQGGATRGWTVGDPPVGDLSDVFQLAGKPLALLDLRALPKGAVSDWFRALRPMREIGAVFSSDRGMINSMVMTDCFDALLYVEETTRARPVR